MKTEETSDKDELPVEDNDKEEGGTGGYESYEETADKAEETLK